MDSEKQLNEKKSHKINEDYSVSDLPRVWRIEPSALCNLNCIHCPTNIKKITKGNMPEEVFNKIIKELKTCKSVAVVVLYHGGEPFLNKKIFYMIDSFKNLNIPFIKIVTNGMCLNDEMIVNIIKSKLDSIEFSLDGLSPEENNKIRRGCDYHQVVSKIKKLLRLKEKFQSKTPEVCIANTQIPTDSEIKSEKEISTPKYFLEDLAEFKNKINFKNTYMLKWPGLDFGEEYKLAERPSSKKIQSSNFCDQLTEMITIRWNGDVVPCCYDITSEYVIGNIMKNSLSEIWNNEKYREIRRSVHTRKYMPLCINCNMIKPQLFVVKNEAKN